MSTRAAHLQLLREIAALNREARDPRSATDAGFFDRKAALFDRAAELAKTTPALGASADYEARAERARIHAAVIRAMPPRSPSLHVDRPTGRPVASPCTSDGRACNRFRPAPSLVKGREGGPV